jgi:hypothetical protein
VPEAITEKVADWPTVTVVLAGWEVMVGANSMGASPPIAVPATWIAWQAQSNTYNRLEHPRDSTDVRDRDT